MWSLSWPLQKKVYGISSQRKFGGGRSVLLPFLFAAKLHLNCDSRGVVLHDGGKAVRSPVQTAADDSASSELVAWGCV